MNISKIKTEFHKLIDSCNNAAMLEEFYKAMSDYSQKENIVDVLSEKQQHRLMDAMEQYKAGKVFSHTQVQEETKKWLTK